jgi:hypothetical protein
MILTIQLVNLLPGMHTRRKWLVLLLIAPICAAIWLWSSVQVSPTTSTSNRISHNGRHPIETLVEQAQVRFVNKLSVTSDTLEEAVLNYRARYGRDPPPGFDKWFELAQSNDFMLVDEFDTIMDSLEPYWQVSPSLLRDRISSVPDEDATLVRVSIRDGRTERKIANRGVYQANVIQRWLEKAEWLELLPDMTFVVNRFDEPRGICVTRDNFDLQQLTESCFSAGS